MLVQVRRIHCKHCGARAREVLDFCPSAKVSYTKWLARYVLALRAEMSIRATAKNAGLHWQGVKDIEKTHLGRKYAKISLGSVRRLGIDEVYLGRKLDFITVVRDLENGANLAHESGEINDRLGLTCVKSSQLHLT